MLQISEENKLTNLVCDYCHNLIFQFYGYFETVNKNQDLLIQNIKDTVDEKIFVLPLVKVEEKDESFSFPMDDDTEMQYSDGNSPEMSSPASDTHQEPIKSQKKDKSLVTHTKDEMMNMSYFELLELRPTFTFNYSCEMCPRGTQFFENRYLLVAHMATTHFKHIKNKERRKEKAKRHAAALEPVCSICKTKIPSNKKTLAFRDHVFIHHGIKPYECEICNRKISTKNIMNDHIKLHKQQLSDTWCDFCRISIPPNETRSQHMNEKHKEHMIICDYCGTTLVDKKSAKEHFHEHLKVGILECERCVGGVRFPNQHVLSLHRKRHILEDKNRNKFRCRLCERSFNNEAFFHKHQILHAKNRLSVCGICGKTYVGESGRKISKHELLHKEKEKPQTFDCDKCDEVFATKRAHSDHYRRLHDPKEQSCYRCGKMIPAYLMSRHLNFCIGGNKIKCVHCPMQFSKTSERDKHNRLCHIGYKCLRCDVSFENQSQLEFHRRYDKIHLSKKRPRRPSGTKN